MQTYTAHFDGEKIVLPRELSGITPGEVLIMIPERPEKALPAVPPLQDPRSMSRVWADEPDAGFDQL